MKRPGEMPQQLFELDSPKLFYDDYSTSITKKSKLISIPCMPCIPRIGYSYRIISYWFQGLVDWNISKIKIVKVVSTKPDRLIFIYLYIYMRPNYCNYLLGQVIAVIPCDVFLCLVSHQFFTVGSI